MPGYFLDTSALVKYYHVEAGTPAVEQLFQESDSRLVLSRIGLVEMHSAFAGKVRNQEITEPVFDSYRRRVWADVSGRRLEVYRIGGMHFQVAEQLIVKYGKDRRMRTLDAVQLAIALDGKKQGVVGRFVCADSTLCDIAATEHLAILNPVAP